MPSKVTGNIYLNNKECFIQTTVGKYRRCTFHDNHKCNFFNTVIKNYLRCDKCLEIFPVDNDVVYHLKMHAGLMGTEV